MDFAGAAIGRDAFGWSRGNESAGAWTGDHVNVDQRFAAGVDHVVPGVRRIVKHPPGSHRQGVVIQEAQLAAAREGNEQLFAVTGGVLPHRLTRRQ